MFKFIKNSLRLKLILTSLVIEMVMLGLLLANSVRLNNSIIEEQTQLRIESINPLLRASFTSMTFNRNYETINSVLQTLIGVGDKGFKYLVLIDERGDIYAQSSNYVVKSLPLLNNTVKNALKTGVFNGSTMLKIDDLHIGEVRYGLSINSFIKGKEIILKQGFMIASIEIILTAFLLGLTGYFLTRHLGVLLKGTESIRDGNYDIHVKVKSKDEIGLLASEFNLMAGAIRERISELNDSKKELDRERKQALVTLENITDAVITIDKLGCILYMNHVAQSMLWTTNEISYENQQISDLFKIYHDLTDILLANPVLKCIEEQRVINFATQVKLINVNGNHYTIEYGVSPIRNEIQEIIGVVLVLHDVGNLLSMESQLDWQSSHDALTGLINRHEFEYRVNALIQATRENESFHSIIHMNLDQFKVVNETCSHIAGDELLKQLSSQFLLLIRDSDTFARLGGDEFGLLMPDCPLKQAQRVADTLLDAIKNFNFEWDDKFFSLTASIGIAIIDKTALSLGEVLSNVDTACYAAKDNGHGRYHIYHSTDNELIKRQSEIRWVEKIKLALEKDDFVLYSQPIVSINNKATDSLHFELLLRLKDLNNPGKVISPFVFMPAAERYFLMPQIDRWVINNAFNCLINNSYKNCILSINLSGQTLGDDSFLDFVINKFNTTVIDPSKICFEITETAAISNYNNALNIINKLRSIGCEFSLDDFGSGLSSFSYLKDFPVDYLKIDGSFVKDMTINRIDTAMVTAINDIGHVMKIKTIAEYVENDDILKMLADIGVDYAQGYGIGKPIPMTEVLANLQKDKKSS